MKTIQMVDLQGQYEKIKKEIDARMQSVIESSQFINGPEVLHFQQNLAHYTGSKHVITCANGTDALQIALMALGLKPGDEVITVPFTFVSTAEVVALLGMIPVFVDVFPGVFNMDPFCIEAAITPRTKAIVPVHLFGQCANMEVILDIAHRHHLFVIEDACQAMGAEVTFDDGTIHKAGTMGDIGVTSFFPSKNLGCYGDGGAIFTQNDDLADKMKAIVNHGMSVRYHYDCVGVNSRLDSIQAAILNVKLQHLDEYIAARQKAAAFYDNAFKDCKAVATPLRTEYCNHVFHQYTMRLSHIDRQTFMQKMQVAGIPTMVYYPIPLHLQKAYAYLNYKRGQFPVAEYLSDHVLSLPMHTELDEEQLSYIVQNFLDNCSL